MAAPLLAHSRIMMNDANCTNARTHAQPPQNRSVFAGISIVPVLAFVGEAFNRSS